jgi:hypothetical protein
MRKKLALALLASLVLFAAPPLSTATMAATTSPAEASADLQVDDFLLAGIVTTELVAAVRCPVITSTCSQVDAVCGPGCHCKAGGIGGQTLVCVKNPCTPPCPIE